MFWAPVDKHPQSLKATANLLAYDIAVAAFSWDAIRAELQGLPGGRGLNIVHEAVVWGVKAMGLPIHDNWWQTETGGIIIANYPALVIRSGSMSRPLPGIEAAIVKRAADHMVEVIDEAEVQGELAL